MLYYGGKKLLKERLGAIISFKKKSKSCIVISTILTITLCFGAEAKSAYVINTSVDSAIWSSQTTLKTTSPKDNIVINYPALAYTGGIAANNNQYGATLILNKGDIITISLLEDLKAWNLDKNTLKLEIFIGGNNGTKQKFILSNTNRSITFKAKETATHFIQMANPNKQLLNYKFSLEGFSQPPKIEITNLNERRRFGQFLLKANTSYAINASWQEANVDFVTIVLQRGKKIKKYKIKNKEPLLITVPKNGIYILDCINQSSFDVSDFSCTIIPNLK